MPFLNFGDSLYRITGRPEKDEEIKFHVYSNYLTQIVNYILREYEGAEGLYQRSLGVTNKIQGNGSHLDLNYIKRFLTIGWNTEYLLSYNDDTKNPDILRINNQWKPIQAYYSIYSIAESIVYAMSGAKTENHKSCLKKVSDLFATHGGLKQLSPWCFSFSGYRGNKSDPSTISSLNFPSGLIIPNSLKTNDVSPVESIACCLHAEHVNRIDEWERPKGGGYKYLHNPGYTSVFHFLYRLRIKSNYKDGETFMVDAPDLKVKDFSTDLTKIVYFTNLMMETILMRKIGQKALLVLIQEFVRKNRNAQIAERARLYIQWYSLLPK